MLFCWKSLEWRAAVSVRYYSDCLRIGLPKMREQIETILIFRNESDHRHLLHQLEFASANNSGIVIGIGRFQYRRDFRKSYWLQGSYCPQNRRWQGLVSLSSMEPELTGIPLCSFEKALCRSNLRLSCLPTQVEHGALLSQGLFERAPWSQAVYFFPNMR